MTAGAGHLPLQKTYNFAELLDRSNILFHCATATPYNFTARRSSKGKAYEGGVTA
jgi:hypothetical protein